MKAELNVKKEYEIRYLKIDAHVRYFEDAEVNGQDDDAENPTMPFANAGDESWRVTIDVDNGTVVDWPEGTTASVHYKVCDEGEYTLTDGDGNVVFSCESYVPSCIGEYGDYIVMDIDENGCIRDWSFTESDVEDIVENAF